MGFKRVYVVTLLLLWGGFNAGAQNSSYRQSFDNGKDLYRLGKYDLAMAAFKPLTYEDEKNDFAEYANFYYALSAYHAGKPTVAKNMFLQLVKRYPSWENIDNAHYWLANLYFEDKEYPQAFQQLKRIKDTQVKKDALEMQAHYLAQISDIELLQQLLQQNPYDKAVAVALADEITRQPLVGKNRQLLDFLIDEFDLDSEKYSLFKMGDSEMKESYNVAVVFPFMYDSNVPAENQRMSEFVLEVYKGISFGREKLAEEGIKINLFAYDTRKDSLATANLLATDEMKTMDLIVGPLYPVPSRMVSRFSRKYKINMVNPLSSNSEVIGNNPLSFLFKPSLETQARQAALYAAKNFTDNKNVRILYGASPKDSVLAFTYRQAIEQDSFKVVNMERITTGNTQKIIDILAPEEFLKRKDLELDEVEGLVPLKPTVGHAFVASDNELTVASAISALEIRGDKLPMIGLEEWLDFKFVSYEQLERLQIVLIAPSYINYEKPSVKAFKETYMKETNSLPSIFAYTGYGMMTYFGEMLHKYGTYFQTGFDQEDTTEGTVFPGHNYSGSNDNQYVPLVQFKDAELTIVNK